MKRTIIVFLIIIVILFGAYTSWRTHNGSTDFDTYYFSAKNILDGNSPYLEKKGLSPYIYPPLFASLITPLTLFNLETAAFLWYLLTVILSVLSIGVCFKMIFGAADPRRIWPTIPLAIKISLLAVTAGLLLDNISLLQVNILLFCAVAAGLYLFTIKRPLLGGSLIAAAISLKIIPALFLVYFIIKKEFKMALSIVVFVLVFSIAVPSVFLGVNGTLEALKNWNDTVFARSTTSIPGDKMMSGMFNPVNQSITASLSRWLIKNDDSILYWKTRFYKYPAFMLDANFSLTRAQGLMLSRVMVCALAIGTLLFCMLRRKTGPPELNSDFSLIFSVTLFINPLLKTPHLVFMLFPFLFIVSRIKTRKDPGIFSYIAVISAAIFYLLLGVKLFRIMGAGTVSLLLLWVMVLMDRIWLRSS